MNKKRYNKPDMTIFTLKLDNPLLVVSELVDGDNQLQWSDNLEDDDE